MSGNHPDKVLDPICGMTVDVSAAESAGLTTVHEGRTFAFCSERCLGKFLAEPAAYAAKAQAAHAISVPVTTGGLPVIDEGMRRWYESCSCCLSDAFPEVKAALDAERAAQSMAAAGPGICEIADAAQEPAAVG